ncbi:MAG: hypothetical protein ACRD3G_05775 [Vicinamibacterales bacterium]
MTVRLTTLAIGVLVLTGGAATAQDRGDVSAGYRFLQSEGLGYPLGWYVDATRHVNSLISIVGDVGGAYTSDSLSIGPFSQTFDARIHTFMGGLRVNATTKQPDVIAFGQALLGAAHLKTTTAAGGIVLSRSAADPALNLSAGVDVNGGLPVGLRFQIGWLRVFAEGDGGNVFQFSVGAKFRF